MKSGSYNQLTFSVLNYSTIEQSGDRIMFALGAEKLMPPMSRT